MKKIYQKIRLKKFDSLLIDTIKGQDFYILFDDNTYKHCISQYELLDYIRRDHIKPIRYVFDTADRIILSREVLIEDKLERS